VIKGLSSKLKILPKGPGVYLFKNADGKVIYVGKAKSLKKRVTSYFTKVHTDTKTENLVHNINDIDYITTSSELEALILENNFIKKHRPRYNVILRDDKEYPYIKLTVNEEWPRLFMVRKIDKDGAKYFGPYNGSTVNETLRLLKRLFPVRPCKETPLKMRRQPCMYFYIKHCPGPCVGGINHRTYMKMCEEIVSLLDGRLSESISKMRVEMRESSDRQDYEGARVLRDRIRTLEKMAESQFVVSHDLADRDVIALSRSGGSSCALVFQVRRGRLINRDIFYPHDTSGATDEELMTSVLKQYYADAANIMPEIVLGERAEDMKAVSAFLSKKRGAKVRMVVPTKGAKLKLVKMARDNARLLLERKMLYSGEEKISEALVELKQKLSLEKVPVRIEAFDVSNIQGTEIVGAMVTFVGGRAHKSDYRKFKVFVEGKPNDVASINEIVSRRYGGSLSKTLSLPDLILIDGGAGQVSAARKGLDSSGIKDIPIIGLAKKHEEIYFTGRLAPLRLPRDSASLRLLQRIRDEAHRFAITYHRLRRAKRMKK